MEGDKETSNESTMTNKRDEKLFCKSWPPAGEPCKLVFICHGFGEHCQRYIPMITKLVENGCYVFAHDHVGHGKSEGTRVVIDDFKFFVNDVFQHVTEVKKNFPEIPCFIVGHSMGGAITCLTCLDHPDLFKGAVLIGPAIAIDPNIATPFKVFMARVLSRFLPQVQVGKLNANEFCRDKKQVENILADPLCWHEGGKARMAVKFMEGMMEIERRRGDFKTPYLLIHGTDDTLCTLTGSEAFHQQSTSSDKTFTPYQGAFHQVHNEPDGQGEAAIKELITWIMHR